MGPTSHSCRRSSRRTTKTGRVAPTRKHKVETRNSDRRCEAPKGGAINTTRAIAKEPDGDAVWLFRLSSARSLAAHLVRDVDVEQLVAVLELANDRRMVRVVTILRELLLPLNLGDRDREPDDGLQLALDQLSRQPFHRHRPPRLGLVLVRE